MQFLIIITWRAGATVAQNRSAASVVQRRLMQPSEGVRIMNTVADLGKRKLYILAEVNEAGGQQYPGHPGTHHPAGHRQRRDNPRGGRQAGDQHLSDDVAREPHPALFLPPIIQHVHTGRFEPTGPKVRRMVQTPVQSQVVNALGRGKNTSQAAQPAPLGIAAVLVQ